MRFLPISRTVPKELIPVVDTPVIDIVVTEMTESGSSGSCSLSVRARSGSRRTSSRIRRIEARLAADGRQEICAVEATRASRAGEVRAAGGAEGEWTRGASGASLVGDEPFAMLWGDDIMLGEEPAVLQLIKARERLGGGSVVGCIRVGKKDISRYGVVAGTEVEKENGVSSASSRSRRPRTRRATSPRSTATSSSRRSSMSWRSGRPAEAARSGSRTCLQSSPGRAPRCGRSS